jgi:PAS domain S-box-containing protein
VYKFHLLKQFSAEAHARIFRLITAWWIMVVAVSLVLSLYEESRQVEATARIAARASIAKDLDYRHWASMHGGVYVPVTAQTQPNPYLKLSNRDVTTTDGRQLTLINPSYMVRQVFALEGKDPAAQSHITSLKPIRPGNAPNAWEEAALHRFERGEEEVSERIELTDQVYLRMMRPMVVEESCLNCHRAQGYKLGEIRGGIAVSVPLAPYLQSLLAHKAIIIGVHLLLCGLGLVGLRIARRKLSEQWNDLLETQRVALIGSYHYDITQGAWTSSDMLNEILGLTTLPGAVHTLVEWEKCIHPEDREQIVRHIGEEVATGKKALDCEYRIIRQTDGAIRWVHVKGKLTTDADGCPHHLFGTIQDVTERKLNELELRKLHVAVEQSPMTVVITDSTGQIEYVNPSFSLSTGYTSAEAIGQNPRILKSGKQAPEVYTKMWEDLVAGRQWTGEMCNRRKDGTAYWERAVISPILDSKGHTTHYLAIKEDITDKRQNTERIKELAALLEVTHDAIFVVTLDRRITYLNHSAEQLYQITRKDAIGCAYESVVYQEAPADIEQVWQEFLLHGRLATDRHHTVAGRGEIVIQKRLTLLRDSGGAAYAALIVITDVTETKRLEEKFYRAQRMETVGTLASGIAHDLNNMLAPILIGVDLLEPLARGKRDSEMIQVIRNAAKRGGDTIAQLLIFARGDERTMERINLRPVLRELQRMMRDTFRKDIAIHAQLQSELWMVEANRTHIYQVLLNLCVNARDAMPNGGQLTIRAANCQVEAAQVAGHKGAISGPHVVLEVSDNGTGIAPDALPRIFDPFYTTKPQGEGTGLGLATVDGIVRGHGGFIEVSSTLGQGSLFSVYLPATPDAQGAADLSDVVNETRGTGELLLIVDDEASVRQVLQILFKEAGYRVETASNAGDAAALFRKFDSEIRAVVSDVTMPGESGVLLATKLRAIRPDLPIVLISGLTAPELEGLHLGCGKIRFVPKPFEAGRILREVRDAIDGVEI